MGPGGGHSHQVLIPCVQEALEGTAIVLLFYILRQGLPVQTRWPQPICLML